MEEYKIQNHWFCQVNMDAAIASKQVAYDFARLMDDAKEVKCSEFADVLIDNI